MTKIRYFQLLTRLALPALGLVILSVFAMQSELLILYDGLVTFTPFFLALTFAPYLQLYGYERARSAGGKSQALPGIRSFIGIKIFVTGAATFLITVYFSGLQSDFWIDPLILIFGFCVYALFCLARALQHPLLAYTESTRSAVGYIEVFFSLFFAVLLGLSLARSGAITYLSFSFALALSLILSMTVLHYSFRRVSKYFFAAISPSRNLEQSIKLQIVKNWLPTLIFCISILYAHLDRFILYGSGAIMQIEVITFTARITSIIVSLWIFYLSLEYSPKIYKLYRNSEFKKVDALSKKFEEKCVLLLILLAMVIALLVIVAAMFFENNLFALLMASVFFFGKIITLVYANFVSILLTMQGKQRRLLIFGIIQCIPVLLLSVMTAILSETMSFLAYLALSSSIAILYYYWEYKKYENYN